MTDGFKVAKTVAVDCSHVKVKIPKIVSVRLEGREVIATLECGHESVLFTVPKKRTTCYKCKGEVVSKIEYRQGFKVIPLATEKVQ